MDSKGFTLVEVLATVSIMVLIMLIAVPTSMKFIERGKNQQYKILEDQIISAASKYYIKHKNEKCILISEFINEVDDKFIDGSKIIDPRNNKELTGVVEVSVDENKVIYKLNSEVSNVCSTTTPEENYPFLAAQNTWYKGKTAKEKIEEINIVDSYNPTGNETESWNAGLNNDIMCYIDKNILYIAGNGSGKISANTQSEFLFSGFSSVTSINGLNYLDTSLARSMYYMFSGCSNLTSLNVSSFNTSNVKNMTGMFSGCSNLTSLNVSSFNTSKVTSMDYMFSGCSNLTSLDVSNFDTSNVTNMYGMFYNCTNLTTIYVSDSFNTSSVTNMIGMFSGCSNLTSLNVSSFNTSKVTRMDYMFSGCSNLTSLDVSNFDTSNVTNMYGMFYNCTNLTTIYVSDSFNTSSVTNAIMMFYNSEKLTGGNGTKYNSAYDDATYARIDAPGTPGYFTLKEQ